MYDPNMGVEMTDFAKVVETIRAIMAWFMDTKVSVWLRVPIGTALVIVSILVFILLVLTTLTVV